MKKAKSIDELPLLEQVDSAVDANAERLWIEEAQRRYDAYLRGELEASPGEDVMNRARERFSCTSEND